MFLLFLISALISLPCSLAQENSPAKPLVRSCPDSWKYSAPRGKKDGASSKKKQAAVESGVCIELAFSVLDIQEYLQSYARQQRWVITTDQLGEDSWTFSLAIDKDELLRDTTAELNPKGVEWTGGAVRVLINTVPLPDGFSRTTVRASFRGFGNSADQFASHKEYWELESSNVFENSVVSVLRDRFSKPPTEKTSSAQP